MKRGEQLIEIFEDTRKWCQQQNTLIQSVEQSIQGTKVYEQYWENSREDFSRLNLQCSVLRKILQTMMCFRECLDRKYFEYIMCLQNMQQTE